MAKLLKIELPHGMDDNDWEKLNNLLPLVVETDQIKEVDSKAKPVAELWDEFGYDTIYQLNDGRVAWTDRNSGLTNISKGKQDAKDVIAKMKKIFSNYGNGGILNKTFTFKQLFAGGGQTKQTFVQSRKKLDDYVKQLEQKHKTDLTIDVEGNIVGEEKKYLSTGEKNQLKRLSKYKSAAFQRTHGEKFKGGVPMRS